jgi:hypothetical protein
MKANEPSRAIGWSSPACLVPLGLFVAAGLCVHGVTGFFRLGSDTATMRQSLMNSIGGTWNKTIAVNVGGLTLGLVRVGSRFFPMDPQPRAAFESARGAEVGVYRLVSEPLCADRASILATVDKAMAGRGWDRVVGVCKDQDLVGVYVPRKRIAPKRMRACVMVWHGRDLVVASARGNLEPLLALAAKQMDFEQMRRQLAVR